MSLSAEEQTAYNYATVVWNTGNVTIEYLNELRSRLLQIEEDTRYESQPLVQITIVFSIIYLWLQQLNRIVLFSHL